MTQPDMPLTSRPFLTPVSARSEGSTVRPTFSVVIPAYQAAGFIKDAVESLLAQTVPPLEIIVSDDGSTDDLQAALLQYADRVRLVRGDHRGLAAARNLGFRAASGDFIANLDADDVVLPEWLEALGELATTHPDLDILTTNGYLVHEGSRLHQMYKEGWAFPTQDQRGEILRRTFISSFAAVRRVRFCEAGGFDESIYLAWDLWVRLILDGSSVGCVDEPLFEYRVREGSVSTNDDLERPRNVIRMLEKAAEHPTMSSVEHERLLREIEAERRTLRLLEAKEALLGGDPHSRTRALRVAFGAGQPLPTRLKMVVSALAPSFAQRQLQRERAQFWVGGGGTVVPRE